MILFSILIQLTENCIFKYAKTLSCFTMEDFSTFFMIYSAAEIRLMYSFWEKKLPGETFHMILELSTFFSESRQLQKSWDVYFSKPFEAHIPGIGEYFLLFFHQILQSWFLLSTTCSNLRNVGSRMDLSFKFYFS